ncbi:MAG: UDP-glucose 4-epimerase GalE [Dehalococcoidia bacterium]|nr:UDP-glucose 4-epimerase GalE [Dehalococcoidia bacterium]
MRVLVTGGAGFIGSVTVAALLERGHHVTVYDNLSTGYRRAVHPDARLVDGELHDFKSLWEATEGVEGVVHFAGLIAVAESVEQPAHYYQVNVGGTQVLLDAVADHGNLQTLVFSSSAAVYGEPLFTPIVESSERNPVNPYGETKLLAERLIEAYADRFDFRWVGLRYFNAAGATPALGEAHNPEAHLLPNVVDAALGRKGLTINGFDYQTPDGTCVRDYVHVLDLAQAHVLALEKPVAGAFNVGGGRGYSNLEVVRAVEGAVGREVPFVRGQRRPGDPAVLVASVEKSRSELGWQPARDLAAMARDALAWRESHPSGYD